MKANAKLSLTDAKRFIRANMHLRAVATVPEIRLYQAHPASGLHRLIGDDDDIAGSSAPYWAYPWAGGLALARYLLDQPDTVKGRRVLDLGSGSGLVAVAAAKSGARHVLAAEIDRNALAALELNAAANGVRISATSNDLVDGLPPSDIDLIAAGDLFFDAGLATRVTAFLSRCLGAGIDVLVGDPGRVFLPMSRLNPIAEYTVSDVGDFRDVATRQSAVYAFMPEDTPR